MARPIPNLDFRYISSQEIKPKDDTTLFEEAVNRRPKNSTRDLLFGTFSGWISGIFITKLGKIAAFGLGGSVILLHFANEWEYVHVNWDRIMDALSETQTQIDKIHNFVKRNNVFSVGFVGGFFLGMATV